MKIVIADSNLSAHRSQLDRALPPGVVTYWHDGVSESALHNELAHADVYVGGRFSADMANSAPRLRLVHVAGAGADNIDFDALDPGVVVANTFNHEQSIAEYIVSIAVMLRRGFLNQHRSLQKGVWASSVYDHSIPQPDNLSAARIGFVGFGHIGKSAWNLFRAFGSTGIAVTGRGNLEAAEEGLEWAGPTTCLSSLMAESDVVVVSAPLSDATRSMIGADELAALGPNGILINVGRGPLVDETALYEALDTGAIAGAGIDVWYDYPASSGLGLPSAMGFGLLPNVIMTPHSSGITHQTFEDRALDIAANIGRLSRGEVLHNVVGRPPASEVLA
ncbi:2-hydroxyacid dehydrogenase [Rhodococcus erythropolis]|uniref:2-hydroxyacid dehydrogenase n=1 Tax=Rhodococcus erythropolis TaxID=1833 RepID=UPI00379829A4